jgi:hypothetical protein
MPSSSVAVSSSMSRSPNRRRIATSSPRIGAHCLTASIPNTAQQKISAATTFGPYLGDRGRPGVHDPRSQRLLERLSGMVAMPSGGGAQLIENPALPGLVQPRVAIAFVTALRSANVNSVVRAHPAINPPQGRRAVRTHSQARQRIGLTRAF